MSLPPPGPRIAQGVQRVKARLGLGPREISQTSPLLDAEQAAKLLGVPPTWLLAQARKRAIPHHRLGHYVRFDADELIQWVNDNRIDPRYRAQDRS